MSHSEIKLTTCCFVTQTTVVVQWRDRRSQQQVSGELDETETSSWRGGSAYKDEAFWIVIIHSLAKNMGILGAFHGYTEPFIGGGRLDFWDGICYTSRVIS